MSLDDFKTFLPKYLSEESTEKLLNSLKQFPENIDQRVYTNYLENEKIIFQGDGLLNLPFYDYTSDESRDIKGIILSNTCDIDLSNARLLETHVVYAPILDLSKYKKVIQNNTSKTLAQIENHINYIKDQKTTDKFYLPKKGEDFQDSIVLLDRAMSIPNTNISRNNLKAERIFTLSDYGIYLLIFKLSIHFNRFQDKVERKSMI